VGVAFLLLYIMQLYRFILSLPLSGPPEPARDFLLTF
jgi:hypothetical protein